MLFIIKNKIYIIFCIFLPIILISFENFVCPLNNIFNFRNHFFLFDIFLLNNKTIIIIFKSVDFFKFQNIINDIFIFHYEVTYFFETVIYEFLNFQFCIVNARFGSLNYIAIVCFIVKKVLLFCIHYRRVLFKNFHYYLKILFFV